MKYFSHALLRFSFQNESCIEPAAETLFQMQNIAFEVVYLVVLQIYVVKVNKINE